MSLFPRTLLLVAALGAGAACATSSIDPAAIEDAQTAVRIRSALLNDAQIGDRAIVVRVEAGVVQLSGTVRTAQESNRAADLARGAAGGREVRVLLRIDGGATAPGTAGPVPFNVPLGDELDEPQGDPDLLAVGASVGWSAPRIGSLAERVSVGPLLRLGAGQGFGPAFALNWFQTDITPGPSGSGIESRIHVRPLMFGVGYTVASERVSVSPSIVAGVAFNSLSIGETGFAERLAVEVDNGFAWRPGVSVWLDVSRRFAVTVSGGYIVTGFRVTYLDNGRLDKRRVDGDTTILHAGLAYKLF